MLLAIIFTLLGLVVIGEVVYVCTTSSTDINLPRHGWLFLCVMVLGLIFLSWFGVCQAQTPDSIRTAIALDIIRVAQMHYDPDILKMNPLSMETHEQVRYKRAMEAERNRMFLVKGLLELYHMKLLTGGWVYHPHPYCEYCKIRHGRFYHDMMSDTEYRKYLEWAVKPFYHRSSMRKLSKKTADKVLEP